MTRRPPRLLLLMLAIGLLLAGCSAVGVVYNRLPTLASFQMGRYVDLNKSQKQMFDAGVDRLWRWHRGTQLPQYAADLREIAQLSQQPVALQQLEEESLRMRGHFQVTYREIVRASVPLVASFDDAQVDALLAKMDRETDKRRAKERKLSDRKWIDQRYDKAVDTLKEWTDDATPAQRTRLRQWADTLEREPVEETAPRRIEFESLLRSRRQADFAARYENAMAFDPDNDPEQAGMRQRVAANQALLADLSQTATEAQRAYLRKKLEVLADELEGLSREPR